MGERYSTNSSVVDVLYRSALPSCMLRFDSERGLLIDFNENVYISTRIFSRYLFACGRVWETGPPVQPFGGINIHAECVWRH